MFVFSPEERTEEEIESVYEELLHIKALSYLSNSVKKELSSCISFESHQKKGTVCKFITFESCFVIYLLLQNSSN